jgi:hypothetical protein
MPHAAPLADLRLTGIYLCFFGGIDVEEAKACFVPEEMGERGQRRDPSSLASEYPQLRQRKLSNQRRSHSVLS